MTLTATQVDDLGDVWDGSGDGTVDVEDLGEDEVDLSDVDTNNAQAGTATLASSDVTLDADTDLGDFDIELEDGQELTLTADQADEL